MKNSIMKAILFPFLLIIISNTAINAQDIRYDIPEGYEQDITAKDYKKLVNQAVKIISKNYEIKSVESGVIALEEGQPYSIINLHNLIIKCKDLDKKERAVIVEEHFAAMNSNLEIQEELELTNFEMIKDFLSIRIYEASYVEEIGDVNKIIYQTDLEGTVSVLMLDLPDVFATVQPELMEIWQKTAEVVFEIAQQNINKQEMVTHTENVLLDSVSIDIHAMESEDYAASYILDLENNKPEYVGEWGSIIAVPNKGFVMICEINKENSLNFVKFIQGTYPLVNEFYNQHPQRISTDFFWYYKGTFTKVNTSIIDGNVSIIAPYRLSELMTQ